MAAPAVGIMNVLVYHFVSGNAFFSGNALLLAGILIRTLLDHPSWRITGRAMVLSGAGFITLSATPLPLTVYLVWSLLTIAWLAAIEGSWFRDRWKRILIGVCAALAPLATTAIELPYHVAPSVPENSYDTLYVIGDSIAAGMRQDDEHTWPSLLRKKMPAVRVIDLAHPGATVQSALRRQASRIKKDRAVILLEIGGNDLLGNTSGSQFGEQLDALLETVSDRGRLVVMLELPLTPFANVYGRAQRRLAAKHGAVLIPKSHLADILADPGDTIDGIHLSKRGHSSMAAMLQRLLSPALATSGRSTP